MNLYVHEPTFLQLDQAAATPNGTTAGTTKGITNGVTDGTFGMELLLDLGGCDRSVLDDPHRIRGYLSEVVDRIGMTAYGAPLLVNFGQGELAGWTGVQLITTSSIGLHAVPA